MRLGKAGADVHPPNRFTEGSSRAIPAGEMRVHRPSLLDRLLRHSNLLLSRYRHTRFLRRTRALVHRALKRNRHPESPLDAPRLIRPFPIGAVALGDHPSKLIRLTWPLAAVHHKLAPRSANFRQLNVSSLGISFRLPAPSQTRPIAKGVLRPSPRSKLTETRPTLVGGAKPTGISPSLPKQRVGITPRLNRPTLSLPVAALAFARPRLSATCQRTATQP